jgi:integrase
MTAGTTRRYHLYQRRIKDKASGKPVKAWYYWFYDGDGKRVRRSCGESKVPCLLRREAEEAIARIEAAEADREKSAAAALAAARSVRFRDIAAGMYQEDGKHMRLRVERGEALTDITMDECAGLLKNWILPKWGDMLPSAIGSAAVEDWLMEADRSNSWRNRVIEVMGEVFSECVRYEVIPQAPHFARFKRRGRKQSILDTDEIAALFPDEQSALDAAWTSPDPREPKNTGLMFGALFALMLSTGMRSGEARAVRYSQIDRKRSGVIINQAFDARERVITHLKKGDDDDPRLRAVIVPDRAMRALGWWIKTAPKHESDDLVFVFRGGAIRKEHLTNRFALGLKNAEIKTEGRKVTPHALRYTYTTRMRRLIPGEPLRLMTGHQDKDMTDYYTRTELEGQLVSLQEHRPAIERFWG